MLVSERASEQQHRGMRADWSGRGTVIANGHYSDPFIPYVQGLWNYKGKVTHS